VFLPKSGFVLGQGLVTVFPSLVFRHVFLAEGLVTVLAFLVSLQFDAAFGALRHPSRPTLASSFLRFKPVP
jgi:hypothetical protein